MRVIVKQVSRLGEGLVTKCDRCSPCFGHMSSSKASKRPPNEVESRLHKAAISDPKNVRYVRLMSTNAHDVAP